MDDIEMLEQMEREEQSMKSENYGANVKNKSKKKQKDTRTPVSCLETSTHIVEQIKTAGIAEGADGNPGMTCKFLIYNKKTRGYKVEEDYSYDGRIYRPIQSKLVDKGAIYLSTGVEEYESLEKIVSEIREYYDHYFEAPDFFRRFLPYYTVFTWVYDKFPFIPYLHFVGRTSTGKSWAAETIASLCYKAIDAAGSVTIASLFRAVDVWNGTVYLDEFDLNNFGSEGKTAMENFMKAGVSDRSILRVEGEKKREVVPYSVKSPKIFTSETPISSPGLQSRTLVIQMEKNKKRLPLYKLTDYHERGESIRNKLLLWRLHTLNEINLKDIEFGFEELEVFDRRVQQVLTPVYYLAGDKAKKEILTFAKKQEEETKRQRLETEEGLIFSIMYEYWNLNKSNPELKGITEQVNKQREDDGYKSKRTERKIGEIVRKILGFETEVRGHEKRAVVLLEENENKIFELRDYYGINDVIPGIPTATPANTANPSVKTDDTEEVSDDVIETLFGS